MATLKIPVTEDDHIQGPDQAPITLVEYGDYQCPICRAAYPIVKRVQAHWGNQLRFVFRNFPITNIHPFAEMAAEAAEFASDKGKFWEMHDLLYENQENLSFELIVGLAKTLHLSENELDKAIQEKTYKPKIKRDFLGGIRSGVNGTPTFYINNQRCDRPFTELNDMIKSEINTTER